MGPVELDVVGVGIDVHKIFVALDVRVDGSRHEDAVGVVVVGDDFAAAGDDGAEDGRRHTEVGQVQVDVVVGSLEDDREHVRAGLDDVAAQPQVLGGHARLTEEVNALQTSVVAEDDVGSHGHDVGVQVECDRSTKSTRVLLLSSTGQCKYERPAEVRERLRREMYYLPM